MGISQGFNFSPPPADPALLLFGLELEPPGEALANGRSEGFIRTLKKRKLMPVLRPRSKIRGVAGDVFINTYYDPLRLHSAVHYCSPLEFKRVDTPDNRGGPQRLSLPRATNIAFP